ncbi:24013_t:CDS:2, partial [Gigaspora margarita]
KTFKVNPEEQLKKFLDKHIKYLERERKRVENFFKVNGIRGNLSEKLNELQNKIDEGVRLKDQVSQHFSLICSLASFHQKLPYQVSRLQKNAEIALNLINKLSDEKRQLLLQIEELMP